MRTKPKLIVGVHAVVPRSDLSHEMINVGAGEIGVREVGNNRGARVAMYQKYVGIGSGEPWCAAFASWCIGQAAHRLGVTPHVPKSGSSQQLYVWARSHGAILSRPEAGCIGLERGGPYGHHHTFMVTGVRGHEVASIDGNYGNAVRRTFHPIHRCDFMREW